MIIFCELKEWQFNPQTGNVDLRMGTTDGKIYEASFQREMVPDLLVRMHQMLSATVDEFPRGYKELVEAYIPKSISIIVLPNGDPALEFVTQTDMRIPIRLSNDLSNAMRQALAQAAPLISSDQENTKH